MKNDIDGHQYEYQCADILRSKGFSKVTVTKGSGDQGIDVIAYKDGQKYGIQCKYYASPVGNKAVQEAFAGAKFYDCDVAAVMTNNTFTKSAKELANKIGVVLWENSRAPSSNSHFRLTKWIGIFSIVLGAASLLFLSKETYLPVLQAIEAIFLIFGGLCNVLDNDSEGIELLACLSYTLSLIFSVIFSLLAHFLKDVPFNFNYPILIFALISFLRAIKLRKAEEKRSKELNQKVEEILAKYNLDTKQDADLESSTDANADPAIIEDRATLK